MPMYEYWPDTDAVALSEDDGQVRLLVLQPPDDATLSEWLERYPHLPVTEAVQHLEDARNAR